MARHVRKNFSAAPVTPSQNTAPAHAPAAPKQEHLAQRNQPVNITPQAPIIAHSVDAPKFSGCTNLMFWIIILLVLILASGVVFYFKNRQRAASDIVF